MPSHEDLTIKVHPLRDGTRADYLQDLRIPVSVLNHRAHQVKVENILVSFKPQWVASAQDAVYEAQFSDFTVSPRSEEYRWVNIRPGPILASDTNVADVVVSYRNTKRLNRLLSQTRKEAFYIVLQSPPKTRGQIFISYKDPEDADLAQTLLCLCERVGFQGYIAPADAKPGSDIWDQKIPDAIRKSCALLVVWSRLTVLGTGVSKEIRLARKLKVRDVPFIEKNAPIPDEYRNMKAEITWFDRKSAASDLCKGVVALR